MAHASAVKAFFVAVVLAIFAVASAQEAPAPAPDAGAAFGLPVATAFVGASVLLSMSALLRH